MCRLLDSMPDTMSQLALLDEFSPAEVAAAVSVREAELAALGPSRALRMRHQAKTRRVDSDEKLAALVPAKIDPGDSWHILSNGDIDVLSILRHLLTGVTHFDSVLVTTWRINKEDLEQIDAWLDAGRIEEFHLLIDQRFGRLAPDEYQMAKRMAADYCGSVTTCLNHSKVTLCNNAAANAWLVVESSANVNTNRRLEQSAVHNSQPLFDFYKEAFDGIRSRRRTAAP